MMLYIVWFCAKAEKLKIKGIYKVHKWFAASCWLGDRLQNSLPYAIGPLSCLSVCLSVWHVGVLWPDGWMDQGETWLEVGLSPVHIVLDGDPAPWPKRGTAPPQFLAHVCCGQMAGWIKMQLGM